MSGQKPSLRQTYAARLRAAICRNQPDIWFQLVKIRVTTLSSALSSGVT
jgi:hypothetical protein